MTEIKEYSEITSLIHRIKVAGRKFYTNFFLDKISCEKEIDKGNLYYAVFDENIFILKKYRAYFYLFFLSNNLDSLSNALTQFIDNYKEIKLISDVISSAADLENYTFIFKQADFRKHESLVRMSRKTVEEKTYDRNIQIAVKEDAELISRYFEDNFDELSEHIPDVAEIKEWIENQCVIKYESNHRIAGFVIYKLTGITSYLRYWFVHPDFRNMNIGSKLLRAYFYFSNNTKRELFWVIETNKNAIKRYMHYGFTFENLYNFVFIKN